MSPPDAVVAVLQAFDNPYILLGLAAELAVILFIIYTPAGNWLFGTAPIGAEPWLLALVGAALMGALEEARKAWQRRRLRRPERPGQARTTPAVESVDPP